MDCGASETGYNRLAIMEQNSPCLELAPQLKRPLQLWNPLDYLRLLYWILFFPQALHWYTDTFADPEHVHRHGVGDDDLTAALRHDPVWRRLMVQCSLLTALTPLGLAIGLQGLGVSVDWMGTLSIIALGVLYVVMRATASGAWSSMGFGAGIAVPFAIAYIAFFDAIGSAPSSTLGATWLGATLGAALGVGHSVVGGIGSNPARGLTRGASFVVGGGVLLGLATGANTGIPFAVAGVLSFWVAFLRLPDYVLLALPSAPAWSRGRSDGLWRASRVPPLPMPGLQRRLAAWLAQDWPRGLAAVDQFLAYTRQFIPAIQAVNGALARLPSERLLAAVSEMAHERLDWDPVRFSSASLRNSLWNGAIEGLVLIPGRLRRRWQARFPVEPRLDTPARAACAGFWYLHEGEPAKAAHAFSVVRSLPDGEEMFLIATSLAEALEAEDATAIGRWSERTAGLAELPEPHLRPATLRILHRLRDIAARADDPIHAATTLTQLLSDLDTSSPQPEAGIVRAVAGRWRDVLGTAEGVQ
jgi:hypothetical protein